MADLGSIHNIDKFNEIFFQVPTIATLAGDDSLGELSKTNGSSKKSELSPLDLSCTTNGEGYDFPKNVNLIKISFSELFRNFLDNQFLFI